MYIRRFEMIDGVREVEVLADWYQGEKDRQESDGILQEGRASIDCHLGNLFAAIPLQVGVSERGMCKGDLLQIA